MLAAGGYSYFWFVLDIAGKFGVLSGTGEFDLAAFTAELSIWNDLAFYLVIVLTPVGLYLAWQGDNRAIPIYAAVIIARTVDWFLLLDNSQFSNNWPSLLVFAAQLGVLVYLIAFALWHNPALR